MKRILIFMMTALLSVGAWAAEDLTLNPSETVSFGDWGFENSAAPTLNFSNWAAGGGWQFATPLSQDDYCGVDIAFNATTETHVTFFIDYEGGAEQSIDVPTGSTSIKADFAFTGGVTKIGFKYGDWEATANANGASITITSAVVKANSTGEVVELSFADLSEPTEGYTKDADNQTITIGKYTWASYWSFDPAILSDDYEKIVVTFAEAVPVSGLTINAEVTDDASWCGTALGSITKDGTKATAYFSALPGASITRVGFFLDWQAESATLKIASVKLIKKLQKVTVTSAGYATCVTKAKTDFSKTDGITAYIASVNGSKVKLTEVTKVPAGTGVILKGAAADYTLQPTTEATDDITGNELLVSNGTVTGDGTIYVLGQNSEGKVGFGLLKTGEVLAAGKAYLKISDASRSFIDIDDNVTGIQQVKGSKSQVESYYNLNGQRVAQPTKGVYIVNGKKIIIK